jgi:hypothetical protein
LESQRELNKKLKADCYFGKLIENDNDIKPSNCSVISQRAFSGFPEMLFILKLMSTEFDHNIFVDVNPVYEICRFGFCRSLGQIIACFLPKNSEILRRQTTDKGGKQPMWKVR